MFSVHLVGNDQLDVLTQQTGAPVVGVIGLVGKKVRVLGRCAASMTAPLMSAVWPGVR